MHTEVIEEVTLLSPGQDRFRTLQLAKREDGTYLVTQTTGKTGNKGRTQLLGQGLTLDRMHAKLSELERRAKVAGFSPSVRSAPPTASSEEGLSQLPRPVRLACGNTVTPVIF